MTYVLNLKILYIFFFRKFPFGSIGGVGVSEHTSDFMKRQYDKFKHESPAFGMFFLARKTIVPTDPELVKDIFVRNFESFHDHGFFVNEKADPLSNHLFFTSGQYWKDLRAKLSPTFTSGRMKMMFPIVASKADRMIEYVETLVGSKGSIDLKETLSSYTTEAIASVAFGIEANCHGNPDSPFRKVGKAVFEPPAWENVKNFILISSEKIARFLNLGFNSKETTDFFLGTVRETLEYRERNKIERNDFFQLIMNVMKNEGLSFEEMAANCFVFFLAG